MIRYYKAHAGYLKACSTAGASIYDLDGSVVGKVTEADARLYARKAEAAFKEIEDRKAEKTASRLNGHNRMNDVMVVPAPVVPAPSMKLPVSTDLDDAGLLTAIEKHVKKLRLILNGDDDDLRKPLAYQVVKVIQDELLLIKRSGRNASLFSIVARMPYSIGCEPPCLVPS